MATKTWRCGACLLAVSVRAGTIYSKLVDGEKVSFTTDEALADLARLCSCPGEPDVTPAGVGRVVTDEIRREGQRILKSGGNVKVQLKRATGTRVDLGHVVECYTDGSVSVRLRAMRDPITVPADEWVRSRHGSTDLNQGEQP